MNNKIANKILYIFKSYMLMIGLIAIIIVSSIIEPKFITLANLMNILRQSTVIGICSLGITFVMISGGIDLSLGSIVSICSVVSILIMNRLTGNSMLSEDVISMIAIIVVIATGFIAGLINGLIISSIRGKMGQAFVITYASQIIFGAVAFVIVAGAFQTGSFSDESIYAKIGTGNSPIIIFLAILIALNILLTKTSFGRTIYFFGANMDAARFSGLKTKRAQALTYAICGACAAIGAIIVTSRVASASATQGEGYQLNAIAAAVVGGISMDGGQGNLINTFLGILVIAVLGNALNVMGVNSYFQLIISGAIILIAVFLDRQRTLSTEGGKTNAA